MPFDFDFADLDLSNIQAEGSYSPEPPHVWTHGAGCEHSSGLPDPRSDAVMHMTSAAIEARRPPSLLVMGDMLDDLPPFEWQVEGIVPRHGIACLSGEPGCGKSFLALDLTSCIATGQPFFGRDVTKGRVLFIAGEGLSGLSKRRRAWEKVRNGGRPVGPGLVVCRQAMPFDLAVPGKTPDVLVQLDEELRADVAAHGPLALVVVDTLAACMTAPENDTDAMMRFLRGLRRLTDAFSCAALVLHHPPKAGSDAVGAGFFRGAGALYGALDVGLSLRRDRETRHLVLNPNEKDAKDDEPSPLIGLRLVPVDLGANRRGKPVTSCVLEECPLPGGAGKSAGKTKGPSKGERMQADVLRLLAERGPMKIADMLRALGNGVGQAERNTIAKALGMLEASGLAARDGQVWRAVPEEDRS